MPGTRDFKRDKAAMSGDKREETAARLGLAAEVGVWARAANVDKSNVDTANNAAAQREFRDFVLRENAACVRANSFIMEKSLVGKCLYVIINSLQMSAKAARKAAWKSR